ncbi:MAG TPA: pyridoxal 5'-phosphate synthase glutaminase subunit PdxT [Chloroflexi bacterium]|nr:pyridoxal 5'-phosphate synthase glutaminase subunit PdxT [Chloroflexota bacterium]
MRTVTVGVLALQGAFIEHVKMLRSLGVGAVEVRLPQEMEGLSGLIIPGGESTTVGKLATTYGLVELLKEMGNQGKAIWGTCAGLIFLARRVEGIEQPLLGLMDVTVRRNAFGRQVDSFETELPIPALDAVSKPKEQGLPFPAVFIRAPSIESVGEGVEVLSRLDGETIVAARQGNLLATAFHPELTNDTRLHRYFLAMIEEGERAS